MGAFPHLKRQHFITTLAMKRHAVIRVISDSRIIFPSYAGILFGVETSADSQALAADATN